LVTPLNLENPVTPEMNLYFYFQQIADKVEGLHMEVLEYLVACGTSRGWFPELDNVTSRFDELYGTDEVNSAIEELQNLRLLYLAESRSITSIIGGVTHQKTAHRAMTEDNVAFYLVSALDGLTIAPMLQKSVTIRSKCAQSDNTIEFTVDAEGNMTETSPNTLTAFIPGWDGTASVPKTLSAGGFFLDDEQLHLWQSERGDPDGMPLTQDTIRSVGMEMAAALAKIYVGMSIR